jgi:hypothetical protein
MSTPNTPAPAATSETTPAVVRTVVPLAVGGLTSLLVYLGVDVGPSIEAVLAPAVGVVVGAVYYWLVRMLAKRWPWTERLLGSAQAPIFHAGAPRTLMDPDTGEVYSAYVVTSLPEQSGPRGLSF